MDGLEALAENCVLYQEGNRFSANRERCRGGDDSVTKVSPGPTGALRRSQGVWLWAQCVCESCSGMKMMFITARCLDNQRLTGDWATDKYF